MNMAALIVELVTEELPPKALKRLGEMFAETLVAGLRSRDFLADGSVVTLSRRRDASPSRFRRYGQSLRTSRSRKSCCPSAWHSMHSGSPTSALARQA